jgi:hypothetical protein
VMRRNADGSYGSILDLSDVRLDRESTIQGIVNG